MIQYQLKLRLSNHQEQTCRRWLQRLTAVYNWALRKIELNAKDSIYWAKHDFNNLLAGHAKTLDVPGHTIQATLLQAYNAWQRCFAKLGGKPHLKGRRNKLNSIPFPDAFKLPVGNRVHVRLLGSVKFHKQELPYGKLKGGRIIRRASGWYLALTIDAQPQPTPRQASGEAGIDPGFSSLLTLSTGEKISHPRELERSALRLGQAQRGYSKHLVPRLQERIANQRKDRNHKLSRSLVSRFTLIAFSKDSINGIAKKFGRSVASSSHGQLRRFLAYKSRLGGTTFVEVDSKGSTMTCSSCGLSSGPVGLTGLKVRQWECSSCGAQHDRDVNAAINILIAGAGIALEQDYKSHPKPSSAVPLREFSTN